MFHAAVLSGGGFLPESGRYTAAVWAKWIGKGPEYVDDCFLELGVPYIRFGNDLRFYDVNDVLPLLPRMTAAEDPKRRHGGKRK